MVLLAAPAFATEPVSIPADRVLDAVVLDLDGDSDLDRAVLVETVPGEDAVLHVIVTQKGAPVHVEAAHVAWSGSSWGQQPTLEAASSGSLKVVSENSSIGRERWTITLTLSWRNSALVVSGYTRTSRDTLDPDADRSCDVNLLTGAATVDGKPVKAAPTAIRAADWTDASAPAVCRH